MNPQPLVSIISVNFNEPEETIEFLDSLQQSDYPNIEIIIVDNGSKKKIDSSLESKYPNVTCIFSEKNLGFAGGNNLGIEVANGEYLFFLNNDTLVPADTVSTMVAYMETHQQVGVTSPKILFMDNRIQYAGATDINFLTGRGSKIGNLEEDNGQYDKTYRTNLGHGAAMMVRRSVVEEVGPMPSIYFLYYEEHDWTLHIKRKNHEVHYVGTAHIHHKESVSTGKASPLKTYYLNRNRLLFLRRNSAGITRIMGLLFYLFFAFPKYTLQYLMKGKLNHLRNLWRGVLWHLNSRYDFKS